MSQTLHLQKQTIDKPLLNTKEQSLLNLVEELLPLSERLEVSLEPATPDPDQSLGYKLCAARRYDFDPSFKNEPVYDDPRTGILGQRY